MHELYELKETLCKELEEYGQKNDITASSLEVIDKLAHAVKNIGKIIEMYEEEDEEYSMENRGSYRRGGRMSRDGGGSYAYDMRGGRNNRRGGGRNRRSYADGRSSEMMIEQLEDMMDDAPNERTKQEIQRLVTKMQEM